MGFDTSHPSEGGATVLQTAPPQRSWFGRNWKWFVPLLVLSPLLVCGGVITLLIGSVFGMLKGSQPYEDALLAAQNNPVLVAQLGEPIEAGMGISGSINYVNDDGDADLSYAVSGPNGSATLRVVGTKTSGKWSYTVMTATVDGGPTIDLIGGSTPATQLSP
ncbi:MAG: cytochrome c oxidase assembly factor Coa1 family protein [Planctomycetota bacterium]